MPRTRSLAWTELKIGVLTIAAVVITAVTIFFLTGDRGFPWQRYSLKTRFANVPGLKAGSPVRVAGAGRRHGDQRRPGRRTGRGDLRSEPGGPGSHHDQFGGDARLGFAARRERGRHHRVGVGHADPRVGLRAAGTRRRRSCRDLADQVGDGVENLTALIADIRGGRGTVGKLMTDDQLYAELNRFAASASDADRRPAKRPRHARPAAERSPRRRIARGVAGQHRDADPPHQRRRGQPRQAVERRRVLDDRSPRPRRTSTRVAAQHQRAARAPPAS